MLFKKAYIFIVNFIKIERSQSFKNYIKPIIMKKIALLLFVFCLSFQLNAQEKALSPILFISH
tara:strand:- start:29 stop:217 length:189 start_codon:yes stop_codon:yes gene_type:complete